MGLHDRISKQQLNGNGNGNGEQIVTLVGPAPTGDAPAPRLHDPYGELKTKVHHACIAKLGPELFKQSDGDLTDRVLRAVTEELALDRTPLTREERRRIVREIADDILGYGPLEPLLRDDSVTEVMVNGFDSVYIERAGKLERSPVRFVDDAHVMRIIDKIVSQIGRRVDEASPMVDARLPDGSRVNAIIAPLALKGPTLTIRKFSRDPYTINDLIAFGTLTAKSAQFLAACVRDLAGPLDVDRVRSVDHDLGDGVVVQEGLERPVAEDVVGDLLRDLPPLLAGQRRAVERELLGDRAEHALGELFVRLRREELRTELRDARVVNPRLQLRVRVDGGPLLRGLLAERRRPGMLERGGRPVDIRLDAVGETHRYVLASAARNFFRSFAAACAVTRDFASSRTERENSDFPSASTAGLPRLTASGTARSLGTS